MYEPIGSVVVIDDSDFMLMIMGYNCLLDDKEYEYIGCLYPIGFESDTDIKLFNSDNIKEVLFKGYETENFELLEEVLIDMKENNVTAENLTEYEERIIHEEEEYDVL
ncbi:DUF4176 domain-containing protein [Mollicutes bacterium LVI A0078]|nr:DUF4176 domain-containing protein [Mollicutes bacterium LVI A0075]WOO91729.1 DUF4176 domain-containing protein [Mollicutes bacterium LVI A0078]